MAEKKERSSKSASAEKRWDQFTKLAVPLNEADRLGMTLQRSNTKMEITARLIGDRGRQ